MVSEAQARITINRPLEEAGWRFVADGRGQPGNVICEHRVKKRRFDDGNGLGADFEHAPGGFVDYVLQNANWLETVSTASQTKPRKGAFYLNHETKEARIRFQKLAGAS